MRRKNGMGLFTIGHTNHSQEYFLQLLHKHDIEHVLDVRSTPFSRFTPQFNKEAISEYLKNNGIAYNHMGRYFGARQEDRNLYTSEGYLDFEKMRETDLFKSGLENVIKGLNAGKNIALMCTEKDPFDCHRTIMVARGFELAGIDVNHIFDDGHLETQNDINSRLLKYYEEKTGTDIHQLSMFEVCRSESEWLVEAYRYRNKEIGYHMDNIGAT